MDTSERKVVMTAHSGGKLHTTLSCDHAAHLYWSVLGGARFGRFLNPDNTIAVVDFVGIDHIDFLFEDKYNE